MPNRPLLVLAAASAVALAGCANDETGAPDAADAVDEALQQKVAEAAGAYYVGTSFEGLPLTEVSLPPHGAGTSTSFIYGDCEVPIDPETGFADGGCAPPLEIQTWSICRRPPAASAEPVPFRGARAVWGEELQQGLFHNHEIFTGRKTIAIFGDDRELARRAAERLWPVSGEQEEDFPAPELASCESVPDRP